MSILQKRAIAPIGGNLATGTPALYCNLRLLLSGMSRFENRRDVPGNQSCVFWNR
jgi:hypothetical protein